MNKENIAFIFETLSKMYPNAKTELNYSTDFQLLMSVIMSAQTTDKQVNKITDKLYKTIKYPEDVVKMWLEKLMDSIKSIHYYKTKAKNIYNASVMLLKDPGILKGDLKTLQKLPGVWIKTAKVVSHVLFGARVIAVDTHVFRVVNRLWIVSVKTPEETSELLEKKIEDKYKDIAHHGLILFGRYHCLSRNPKCSNCPFKDICKFYKKSNK